MPYFVLMKYWEQNCNFTYSLLGIETYAPNLLRLKTMAYCNFTYSLLGIETYQSRWYSKEKKLLQFHLLPIRD